MIAIISKKKLVIFSTMKGPSFLLLIRFLFQLFIIKIINKVYMCNNETLSVEFVWIKASLFCVHYFKELKMQAFSLQDSISASNSIPSAISVFYASSIQA